MNVTYQCLRCSQTNRTAIGPEVASLVCQRCGQAIEVPAGAVEGGRLGRCLVCPSTDLFVRKDFPQRLGVLIVTVGFAASCVAWFYMQVFLTFAILFATALIDVVLYLIVSDALMCYRCGAVYRAVEDMHEHGAFSLETHERHRQLQARLNQQPKDRRPAAESATPPS